MSGPADEFGEWISKADEDWLGVRHMLAGTPVPWSLVCFHAHQAAEKYLKAFLVSRGVRPQRSHDLARLLVDCRQHDNALRLLESDCVALADYAVDIRYPDIKLDDAEQMGQVAVASAERICAAIRERLSKP